MMSALRRPGLIVMAGLLAVAILLVEYGLLENGAADREAERYAMWGAYSLNILMARLSTALDYAAVLGAPSNGDTDTLNALTRINTSATHPNSAFNGSALLAQVPANQRAAFELAISGPIQVLSNHHLSPSPVKSEYFPVINYLPDDANALARGLDLGSLPGWEKALSQAQNTGLPVLVALHDSDIGRLAIATPLARKMRFLLFNVDLERLLALPLPDGSAFQNQLRLLAWVKLDNRQPLLLLDSRPDLSRPVGAPIASQTAVLGGMPLQFGTYRLAKADNAPLDDSDRSILLLTAASLTALISLLIVFARRNAQFQVRLADQDRQLAQHHQLLRQQLAERIAAEQARTESEMRQSAILQASSDAILLADHDGAITHANPAATRLIGQAAESLPGLTIGALFPELYDSHQQHFSTIAANFEGLLFEAQLIRNDSSKLPVELALSRVTLPDDQFYLLVCRDISVRKAQEAALIRLKNSLAEQVEMQSRQLAALLDASPLAMAYIADRHLKQVNHAFLEMFDCDEARAINYTTRQFYQNDEQYQRTGRLLYHLLNAGKVVTTELQLQTGRGKLIWVRLHGKALNPAVPGLGTIWVYQDFSAERAAEEALRTAKELAEESSRTKTEFLANMSHELRTPMHAILGFAEMGQSRSEQSGQEKIQQYFKRILTSGNRLLSLLNDLLDLAKMEVGRMEYTLVDDDLARHLRDIAEELTGMAENRRIRIETDIVPQPLIACFDSVRIGQVMRNLLTNAIKFSPPESRIGVEARIIHSAGFPVVWVQVTDQGPGIPAGELESIFDKFIQSSSTKTGAGGTGLGLAICREIIHAHQGEIFADNAAGGGAQFSFTFPLRPRHPL
ncbi:MAG: PAS domain S-box protein [Paludibacterium sp.]|uniref:sensor histidine kinase n=1 Tax=Paludibacterium sp. TaxID=1917523 RepID=UPI0025F9A326|nr:ATP-binding protein [Paludibacterium sp.]MBV8046031.1 PAS domain S-box protein [Paludibacterium sp.]MBV8645927.1 PAS domain S-box protein [Paludibacterium sp.]